MQQKRAIKALAQRYGHEIVYLENGFRLRNLVNDVTLLPINKSLTGLTYNADFKTLNLELNDDDFYDILIQILTRSESYPVKLGSVAVLNLDDYIESEGHYAVQELNSLKKQISEGKVQNKELFGNRVKVEVFNGVLILTDDILCIKSTVIDLEDFDKIWK